MNEVTEMILDRMNNRHNRDMASMMSQYERDELGLDCFEDEDDDVNCQPSYYVLEKDEMGCVVIPSEFKEVVSHIKDKLISRYTDEFKDELASEVEITITDNIPGKENYPIVKNEDELLDYMYDGEGDVEAVIDDTVEWVYIGYFAFDSGEGQYISLEKGKKNDKEYMYSVFMKEYGKELNWEDYND